MLLTLIRRLDKEPSSKKRRKYDDRNVVEAEEREREGEREGAMSVREEEEMKEEESLL